MRIIIRTRIIAPLQIPTNDDMDLVSDIQVNTTLIHQNLEENNAILPHNLVLINQNISHAKNNLLPLQTLQEVSVVLQKHIDPILELYDVLLFLLFRKLLVLLGEVGQDLETLNKNRVAVLLLRDYSRLLDSIGVLWRGLRRVCLVLFFISFDDRFDS